MVVLWRRRIDPDAFPIRRERKAAGIQCPPVSDDFIIIEFRRAGSKSWEHLGRYKTTASELIALKAHLAWCANAYQLLDRIPKKGLIWETLNILKSEGRFARIRFPD